MRARGKNLQALYQTFSDIYRVRIGRDFKYESGEKKRVKKMFTYCAEAMGLRDEEHFQEVLKMLADYLSKKADEWLQWTHRSRTNYIGFLEKREEIEVYVQGELTDAPSVIHNLDIVGTKTDDEWEW